MERIQFFEIYQPLCALRYGISCPAILGVDSPAKCFNTLATCPVPLSFTPEADDLVLRFARGQQDLIQYGLVLPALVSVSVAPMELNVSAMNRSLSALGQRETGQAVIADFNWMDLLVDPYRLERATGAAMAGSPAGQGYDPLARGTFWGKWLARNPQAVNYTVAVREGELGQALEDMEVRYYVIDAIAGPSNGKVTIKYSDLFSRIERRKAVAPAASPGELQAAITAADNNAQLSPPGIGNLAYGAAGYVQVADEVMQFTRAGDSLTFVLRGALGTTAADHDEEDLVQTVYAATAARAHDIVYDLLVNYSAVPAASIDKPAWDAAAVDLSELYTGYVGTPTPVADLIGELCEQAGFTVFVDVLTNMVQLVPLRATAPNTVVADDNTTGASALIVEGTLGVKQDPSKRCSEVWIYYGQKNVAEDIEDKRNYHSRVVVADGDSSYDVPQIREVFSRWIPQFGRTQALETGNRILQQFRDAPREASFGLHADRTGGLALCRPFSLSTDDVQDVDGSRLLHTHLPLSMEREDDLITVKSEEVTFYTEPDDGGLRTIYIDSNAANLNLREIHDQLYVPPVGGSPGQAVTFVIVPGIVVGSTATTMYSMDTGEWPAGVDLSLQCAGRVAGKGGTAGKGGYCQTPTQPFAGKPGEAGGTALKVRAPLRILGDGVIAGGGGGGGGGGASGNSFLNAMLPGGGGGGGAGDGVGLGARSYTQYHTGHAGVAGTLEAGGDGGAGAFHAADFRGGDGGDGGDPGQAGTSGGAGVEPSDNNESAGGAGGAAGLAIEGIAFVTFTGSPSVQLLGTTT